MVAFRLLSIFFVFTFMTACEQKITQLPDYFDRAKNLYEGRTSQNPCELGVPQIAQCYYVVKIKNPTYNANGMVAGITSVLACLQNKHSGNDKEDCSNFENTRELRYFQVEDNPDLDKEMAYDFDSVVVKDNPVNQLRCRDRVGKKCKTRDTEPAPCTTKGNSCN